MEITKPMSKVSIASVKEGIITASSRFIEFSKLFFLNLWVLKTNFIEYVKVVARYYPNLTFMKVDLALLGHYCLKSPFKISKQFLQKRGEKDVYAYGETPLTTFEYIVKQCGITKADTLFELGSGRGRTCFWLNCFVGSKAVGIEFIPEFVDKANRVKKQFGLTEVEFRSQDMFDTDFSGATVVYLYGTCLEEDSIRKLIAKLEKLPIGTKIITVSYPLTDYTKKSLFEVMRAFPAKFTWGTADVYLHLRK